MAGFSGIEECLDWKIESKEKSKAEEIVFVAKKSASQSSGRFDNSVVHD